MDDEGESELSSLSRALADLEMVVAAFPEVKIDSFRPSNDHEQDEHHHEQTQQPSCLADMTFPIRWTLVLDSVSYITLEMKEGYPTRSGVHVVSHRSSNAYKKAHVEAAVAAVRAVAQECLEDGVESSLACCVAALEKWNERDSLRTADATVDDTHEASDQGHSMARGDDGIEPAKPFAYHWLSGRLVTEKKSVFQGHICCISHEADVRRALTQLMDGNSKLHKATHNMWAYRVRETIHNPSNATTPTIVLKHDNDDDGEDAAGGRLAHLLDIRDEDGVLVVVSRWYGGTQLGPRRFALINNVARDVLEQMKVG